MNVIIAGTRTFTDYEFLKKKCDEILDKTSPHVIICGMARGTDLLGKRYAEEKGYPVIAKPAEWDLHGKAAGYLRNVEMAKEADALIAFWDSKSRGTKHMIDIAKGQGLRVRVINYDK